MIDEELHEFLSQQPEGKNGYVKKSIDEKRIREKLIQPENLKGKNYDYWRS